MLKRLCIVLLVFCVVFCAAACGKEAEAPRANITENKIAFTLAGEGTEENPYLISSREDLLQFAAVMNHEEQYFDYSNSHFRLTADITLNDCSDFDTWDVTPPENVWTPIGYYYGFKGVFDGNGHTISGLYINQTVTKVEYDGYSRVMDKFGLFGTVDGEITNLTVKNAYVHPKDAEVEGASFSAGIIAGTCSGTILDCTVEGILICEGYDCGGIVGSGGAEISGCTFTGKNFEKAGSAVGNIGGIAGSSSNIIRNCSVSAQIICEDAGDATVSCANIGGIAGIHSSFGREKVIENCTFNGEIISGNYAGGIVGHVGALSLGAVGGKSGIRNCTNNGIITASEDAGGIVGLILHPDDASEVQVNGCINRGQVRTLATEVCAVGGIVGHIDTRKDGPVIITGCTNEAELRAVNPGGIVGRLMQSRGNVRIEKCTNKGAIIGEGSYAGGILCHIQQWGDNWNIIIDQCTNEGNIVTDQNAGGIVCFAYDVDANGANRELTISNCVNRGNLSSNGINNYMGGILGVNAMAKAPVNIVGCVNEGNLEYTCEVIVDAETLSGRLIMLSRTSGGIVGYVGTAPYLTLNTGERTLDNMNAEKAYLNIVNCSSTGQFLHKEACLADDVDAAILDKWKQAGVDNVLNFFVALEGGMVGTIADNEHYSVNISGCSYANAEREIDDWNRFDI